MFTLLYGMKDHSPPYLEKGGLHKDYRGTMIWMTFDNVKVTRPSRWAIQQPTFEIEVTYQNRKWPHGTGSGALGDREIVRLPRNLPLVFIDTWRRL